MPPDTGLQVDLRGHGLEDGRAHRHLRRVLRKCDGSRDHRQDGRRARVLSGRLLDLLRGGKGVARRSRTNGLVGLSIPSAEACGELLVRGGDVRDGRVRGRGTADPRIHRRIKGLELVGQEGRGCGPGVHSLHGCDGCQGRLRQGSFGQEHLGDAPESGHDSGLVEAAVSRSQHQGALD